MLRVYYDRFSQSSPLFQEAPATAEAASSNSADGKPAPLTEVLDDGAAREPVSGGAARSGRTERPAPRSSS
jgi:hypothetical protein